MREPQLLDSVLFDLRNATPADSNTRGDLSYLHSWREEDDNRALTRRQTVDGSMDSNFEKMIGIASRWRGNFIWSTVFLGDAIQAHDCDRFWPFARGRDIGARIFPAHG